MAAKFTWICLDLLSELCRHLRRQSEVFPLRIKRTNLITDGLQLFAQGLPSPRDCFTAQKSGQHAVFLRNVMADRQARALFAADGDLVLHEDRKSTRLNS